MFDLDGLEDARRTVSRAMPPTPQYRWPSLCRHAGCEVWVKHENHTPIGAFKVRGGLVLLEELRRAGSLPRRIVTATRGNHGQSIPYAARRFGVPVKVVVPRRNSVEKNEAMASWGAEVVVCGDDFEEARNEAVRLADDEGSLGVPSLHPALVRGAATYARELFGAVPDLDTIYVPIGMGSGICGVIRTRDLMRLRTQVVGVVAAGAPAMARSVAAGEIVCTESARTLADGIACRVPDAQALDVVCRGAARIVEVSEADIAEAMRTLYRCTHNVAEGAGAAAFAALCREADRQQGRRVAVVLSGGNVDADVFGSVLAGEVPLDPGAGLSRYAPP